MGQRFDAISDKHREFIAAQKVFFVATATADSRINLSPKGMDSLRVTGPNGVMWINATGSGNETAVHLDIDGRMTIMFCAFEGSPLIMRLYGTARAVHRNDADWNALAAELPDLPGARQLIEMHVDLVQTSCGFGVPLMDWREDRTTLADWAAKKGQAGIEAYWVQKNQTSLDGIPTHIVEKNLAR